MAIGVEVARIVGVGASSVAGEAKTNLLRRPTPTNAINPTNTTPAIIQPIIFFFFFFWEGDLGAVFGIVLATKVHGFSHFIIPFAAGNFIYIAASNLVPELHRHCKLKDTVIHLLAIIVGIGIMALVAASHAH